MCLTFLRSAVRARLFRLALVLTTGFGAVSARAQTLDASVLVPVYTSTLPGAYGSSWTSHLFVRNDGDDVVPISRIQAGTFPVAGPVLLQPHRDYDISANYAATFGVLIHIPANQAGQLRFTARFQDLSRQSSSAGVEIPVVRETALASHIVLLHVPVDARFRSGLRIYDSAGQEMAVRLRMFAWGTDQPLVDAAVPLMKPPLFNGEGFNPTQSNIPDLAAAYPAVTNAGTLRIEIDGATPTLWAMVSTTNNDSQEVTLVTPN